MLGIVVAYGLGSMNDNLPTFVVLQTKTQSEGKQISRCLGAVVGQRVSFLRICRVWVFASGGDPVLYLDPDGRGSGRAPRDARRGRRDQSPDLAEVGDPETNARIAQYEMAFRMQSSVPELADSQQGAGVHVGSLRPEAQAAGTFAYNCLMARRMAERGVRFIQIYKRGWDVHGDVVGVLPVSARRRIAPAMRWSPI